MVIAFFGWIADRLNENSVGAFPAKIKQRDAFQRKQNDNSSPTVAYGYKVGIRTLESVEICETFI